jgi:hypothetical protein
MTQPVYIPLLDSIWGVLYPLLVAVISVVKGLLVGAVVVFAVVKLHKGSSRWRVAWRTGLALCLAVAIWSWFGSAEYTAVMVKPDGIELRYATWPRPARHFAFEQIESVSISTSGRRRSVRHLVVMVRPTGALDRMHWESAAASEENVALAIQWIEHASGGKVTRPPGPSRR